MYQIKHSRICKNLSVSYKITYFLNSGKYNSSFKKFQWILISLETVEQREIVEIETTEIFLRLLCFFDICANSIVLPSQICLKLSKYFCFRSCQVRTWILFKTHSFSQHNGVSCTNLETKMKTFATLLLVFALAAYVSAFERPFHTAVFDFLDERHDERMAQVVRDQGLPKNTLVSREHKEPPEWIVSG